MGTSATPAPGAGTPAPDGGTGGTPPGTGTPGDGSGGGGSAPPIIDRSKLSPVLRALSEEQINGLVDEMVGIIATRKPVATTDAGAATAPPAPAPKPDYKEMFDPTSEKFNPEAAVADIAQRNYGGLISDIGRNASEGVFSQFRETYHDFKEYEQDVRKILKDSGVNAPNATQINTLYFAAKGQRITSRELADRAAARTAPPSAPKPTDKPAVAPLDVEEVRIARRMFPDSQDPEADYRTYAARLETGDTTMKVPLSGGVKR